jgi:hypothetical protein
MLCRTARRRKRGGVMATCEQCGKFNPVVVMTYSDGSTKIICLYCAGLAEKED